MKTFILKVSLIKEEDDRWSAIVPDLPGCSSWGYTEQEALANIKDAAEIYIEDMIDAGEAIPKESDNIEVIDEPAVAISI
jgi:predicted RNase H-like HicB family nuclease